MSTFLKKNVDAEIPMAIGVFEKLKKMSTMLKTNRRRKKADNHGKIL